MEEWNFKGGQQKSGWNTGTELNCASACSWSDKNTPKFQVFLSKEVLAVIHQLCRDVEVEWQMLLTGVESSTGVIATGYYIPKQEVTGSTVKNLDCIDQAFIQQHQVVATIHSHSDMGVFFSPTDEQFTNSSFIKTHLVVNNKHEFVACSRISIPCGMEKFIKAEVVTEQHQQIQINGFDNIVKKTYAGLQWKESEENWWEYKDYNQGLVDMYGDTLKNAETPNQTLADHFAQKQRNRKNRKNKKSSLMHFGN